MHPASTFDNLALGWYTVMPERPGRNLSPASGQSLTWISAATMAPLRTVYVPEK